MKPKGSWFLAAAALAVSAAPAAEIVKEEELPPAVRETIAATHLGGPIKRITRNAQDGRTVYEVEIDAPRPPLRIAEDGGFVREPVVPLIGQGRGRVAPTLEFATATTPLRLGDLPPAVQETAKTNARGREIVDVDRETWKGRTIFEVEYRESPFNSYLYLAEDGSLIRESRPPGAKSWYLGLQLGQTPASVQAAVNRIVGDREIVDVDQKGTEAEPVFRIEFKGPRGPAEIHVRPDGTLVEQGSHAAAPRPDARSGS